MAYFPFKSQLSNIPFGAKGTRETIKTMAKAAIDDSRDPKFVLWVRGQVADVPSKDYLGEARRIFELVKTHVRYVKDPNGLELVQAPINTMFLDGSEDCDSHATLIAAMALALGHHAAFRTVGADPDRPEDWSHVYAMIGVEDITKPDGVAWYPADTTQRTSYLGWNPPKDRVWNTKDWVIA